MSTPKRFTNASILEIIEHFFVGDAFATDAEIGKIQPPPPPRLSELPPPGGTVSFELLRFQSWSNYHITGGSTLYPNITGLKDICFKRYLLKTDFNIIKITATTIYYGNCSLLYILHIVNFYCYLTMWISTVFSFIKATKHNTLIFRLIYVQVLVFVLIHDVGHCMQWQIQHRAEPAYAPPLH